MRIAGIPMSRWVKRIAVALALVGIIGIIVWSLVPQPVPVETRTIARGDLTVTVDEEGRARVRDRHVLTAPLAGTLGRIELDPGDAVAVGDMIARIAPMPAPLLDERSRSELEGRVAIGQARVKQAGTAVAGAETRARFADDELARARTLAEKNAAPRVELERAELAAELARRELESARFAAAVAADELATARAMARRRARGGGEEVEVRAPVAGVVLRVLAPDAGAVAPGTPLVEIGDPARLELAIDVLTADAVEIAPGAPAAIVGWGGPALDAVVRRVEPSATTRISALGVEEQRVLVIADLVDPPSAWAGLGDGWRIEAEITTWEGEDLLIVPLAALFRDGEAWAVYVVEDGRARLRHVEIGRRNDSAAEVLGGLAAGDEVILHPSERVDEGVRVRR